MTAVELRRATAEPWFTLTPPPIFAVLRDIVAPLWRVAADCCVRWIPPPDDALQRVRVDPLIVTSVEDCTPTPPPEKSAEHPSIVSAEPSVQDVPVSATRTPPPYLAVQLKMVVGDEEEEAEPRVPIVNVALAAAEIPPPSPVLWQLLITEPPPTMRLVPLPVTAMPPPS